MFSIYCQLAGVTRNKNVSSEDVMKKLTETLRNKTLKVAGIVRDLFIVDYNLKHCK